MKSSMKFAIALGIGLTTASLGNAQTKERTVTRLDRPNHSPGRRHPHAHARGGGLNVVVADC